MNLFNQKAHVKQMLPPRWRKVAWKLNLVLILTKPLDTLYRNLIKFREEVLLEMNLTPQVIVLESYLNRKTGLSNRQLFIVDTAINGIFDIYLSSPNASMASQIQALLKGKIIAGSNYNIVIF